MKKSIFLFFAAILCAMTANAQWALMGTLTDWGSGKAMTVSGTTATCTVDLAGATQYELKVKNSSTWYGRNSTTISNTTTTNAFNTSGGNVILKTTIPGTYTFSFDTGTKKLTVTYPEVPAPHDITVRAQVPAHWTNDIYAHVWTSENASGQDVGPLTKNGDYYEVTKNAGALYVIFKNGSAWSDQNQTVDLCYTEDVCLQINQSGTAKATATVIECGAVAKDITVKAVVPGAWENTITAWVWPTGGEGKKVTPTKDGNWYVVTENCIELNVIFRNGEDWSTNENQTANIEGLSENTCYQISAINKDGEGKCTYTVVDCEAAIEPEAKPAPVPTFDYYVTGSFNGWNEKDPNHGMTLDGEVYKATVTLAAGENLVKVTNGTWTDAKGYSAMGAEYEEVSAGASDDNIAVTLAAGKDVVVVYNATTKKVTFEGLTEKAPAPTYDYYICGSFNSNNPKNADNGMTLDGEVYKATVTLAEGDNTLKVTDGSWDNTWGYSNLGAAYEEVSDANDYNNIKITLAPEAEKNITVIFNATTGKVTFEGLTLYVAPLTYTVTVPAGTEKCFIAGAMNSWNFQEMTATANENEFTITITGAKETDEYKYACQASWDYVEKKEDGNDLDANRTWEANDVVAKWGVPPTYTVAGDNTAVFGTEWDAENYENNMTLQDHDGTYVWTKPAVYLAGNVEFKVVKNQNWETAWPSENNYVINITEEGFYSLTIYYNPTNNDITVATNKLTAQTASLSLEGVMLEEMEYGEMTLLSLTGHSNDWTTEVGIYLENYTGEDKAYNVYYESVITYNYNYSMYNSVSGQLTQTIGGNGLRSFTGTLNVAFEGYDENTDESVVLPYQLTLTLVEKSNDPTVIVVTDANVDLSAGLTMTGEWTDSESTTYPVLVTVPGFDPSVASAELEAAVTVGGEGEFDPWLGFVEGLTTVTVEDGVVEVTGVLENTWTGVKLDVTISGTLPAAEPETPEVSGKFSIGKYKYAEFALGNLQYNVGTDTWAFAANQYDVIGEGNINLGDPNFTGTIDMFGWSTDDEDNNYGVNPNNVNNLYDGNFVDWGTIAELGEGWETLSADQWKYLLNTRTNAKNLKQIARVGEVVGIMLFPDNWSKAQEVQAVDDDYFKVKIYNYTIAQWDALEAAGAIFLPAAGRRTGGHGNMINYNQETETRDEYLVNGGYYRWQDNTNIYCYYWTSTINDEDKKVAYLHNIQALGNDEYTIGTGAVWSEKGRYGQSVRLAKVTDVTPDYTRTTTAGKFGTICLPFGSTNYTGMELFECVGQETGKVYIASVTTLEAGVPYIFLATGTELAVYSDGTTAATPGNHNGLHGTFTNDTEVAVGNYILKDNALCQAATTCWVNANRAYLVMGEVPAGAPQQMPGRRYIGMSTKGENAATGLDNITNGENTVIKTIENGQLIIIRNGEKFNAQGVRF